MVKFAAIAFTAFMFAGPSPSQTTNLAEVEVCKVMQDNDYRLACYDLIFEVYTLAELSEQVQISGNLAKAKIQDCQAMVDSASIEICSSEARILLDEAKAALARGNIALAVAAILGLME